MDTRLTRATGESTRGVGQFEGKTIIVTGAAGSVGQAVCERLVSEAARVLGVDKPDAPLSDIKQRLQRYTGEFSTEIVDLEDEDSIRASIAAVTQTIPQIDGIVYAAAVSGEKETFGSITTRRWRQIFDINLMGAFTLIQSAVPFMARGTSIVNITAAGAEYGLPENLAYAASKAGLSSLTKGLALKLAPERIRVNAVGPGSMEFPMRNHGSAPEKRISPSRRVPLGRLGRGSDIASATTFLLSDEASWITGQTLYVDGGTLAE